MRFKELSLDNKAKLICDAFDELIEQANELNLLNGCFSGLSKIDEFECDDECNVITISFKSGCSPLGENLYENINIGGEDLDSIRNSISAVAAHFGRKYLNFDIDEHIDYLCDSLPNDSLPDEDKLRADAKLIKNNYKELTDAFYLIRDNSKCRKIMDAFEKQEQEIKTEIKRYRGR